MDNDPFDSKSRQFRGRFMDMVHPSSDVQVVDKLNHAPERPNKPETSEIRTEVLTPTEKDFADDISSVFEPIGMTNKEADVIEEDQFKSPFLPDVKVEKRPLGDNVANNEIPDWIQDELDRLGEPELPADDGASGELEPALPTGVQDASDSDEPELDSESNSESESEPESQLDVRAALDGAITQTHYTQPGPIVQTKPDYQYIQTAVGGADLVKKKRVPIWAWLLMYALLVAVGAAVGALIYMSGWLG